VITSPEQNKEIVRRFVFASDRLDFAAIDEIVVDDYVDHVPGTEDGREHLKAYLTGLADAFPDMRREIIQIIADGDLVATVNQVSGVQKRDFGRFPSKGNRFEIQVARIFRIEEGRIAEHWEVVDNASIERQLTA
jgi:predicted SnoaL-like aldol condensation-catalyzing enzyme